MKRKTLLALVILIVSATASKAQIQKGDVLLGATLGAGYNNNNTHSSIANASIAPRIGLAIGNNSVLGLQTTFGYQRTKPGDNSNSWESINTNIGAGVYWRKFMPIKDKIGWYLEPSVAFTYGKNKQKSG